MIKKIILAILMSITGFFSFFTKDEPAKTVTLDIADNKTPTVEMQETSEEIFQNENQKTAASSEITAASINSCLKKTAESGKCLDGLFREFLKTHTTLEALRKTEDISEIDAGIKVSCHPVVHAIGRETFLLKKTIHDSFSSCDQFCHSGCYHGAMERFLRGDFASGDGENHVTKEEIQEKAKNACDVSLPLRFRFQCLHGLGHALMFFLDYNLEKALGSCDQVEDSWGARSCWGGVFMENVFTATPEKRDLSKTDYHYPCSKLDNKYKSDCYMMQTTRMAEMGLRTLELFDECRKAGDYRYACMQSIGRDISNDARIKNPRETSLKCEIVDGIDRQYCVRGVAYALEDNTWDAKYAFPFCESFSLEEDRNFCFRISEDYLKSTFEKSEKDINDECLKYIPSSKTCGLKFKRPNARQSKERLPEI